jgi:hypothetical protein
LGLLHLLILFSHGLLGLGDPQKKSYEGLGAMGPYVLDVVQGNVYLNKKKKNPGNAKTLS